MSVPLRGQVYRVDLGYGPKPWLVVSDDQRNGHSSLLAARITTTDKHATLPTLVRLEHADPVVGHVNTDDLQQPDRDELGQPLGCLAPSTLMRVFLIGGRLFKHSAVTSGAAAAEAAERVNADLFFVGVTGVHPDTGLTTGDADEAAMKRLLARRAADTYVLASAEKIGAASPFEVVPLAEVAGIITDAPEDDPTVRRLTVPVIHA